MAQHLPYKFKSKKGNDVVFRTLDNRDLDGMLGYINNLIAEDTYIGMYGKPVTREEEEKVLSEMLEKIEKGDQVWIVVEINGRHSGSGEVRRNHMRRQKHVADLGISLRKEYRGEGIGTELMNLLIDEARTMGLTLVTRGCFENNEGACHLYEKMGFSRAGVIPNAIKWKDEYVGEVKFYLSLN
ncbi:hypothetical protein A2875_05275 [Candidatus Gottesmanbacteria bacterium RIFCSPHIGHO2_01_FULL_46_14]|uniref:N-acetyltransferase domain-containing protein n=3 Tax=Candidatus Gottesmaniibacteriota TaxID=1752720 RepID=A0A1F5ZM88_9BACT|nr:MAG: hypothetical protein UY08_C0004G0009 [Candidatus Gottesmanbacteria bacterium GW2011_GWA1_47_8]OGG13531.1 MAG: hypothetical protein A2875_05275 [Candidatus Gottesmanbacteria bacterium RIFCSPHIGHO2_01_FULL_46_14]OGG29049.1 MAG: hypothetical protein A2971_04625 [Candidatus Gottesmanbacteria bacterium RIFCSPLOWO2_01_FULL_46_21]